MSNIFDYLLWRDISMDLLPFNEIDNLILARFSYFPLDGFIKNEEKVTIHELYERYVNGKWGYYTSWIETNYNSVYVSTSKTLSVPTGYYYRVCCVHYANSDVSGSYTDGIYI